MLHIQDGVLGLLQDSPKLQSSRLRIPERMPTINWILNCFRWGLPFRARSISSGAMRTLNDGDQGDGGQEFDFHELKWEGFEDIWGWGGRKKRKLSCFLMAGQ